MGKTRGKKGIGKREFGDGGFERVFLLSITKEAFKLFRATYSCIL
jgi:hypothetical protein